MYRRIFVILVRDSAILNAMTYASDGGVAVHTLVDQIHTLCTAPDTGDGDKQNGEEARQPAVARGYPIAETDSLVLYDWFLDRLPASVLLEELPKPGILIALVSSADERLDEDALRSLGLQVRMYAEKANEKIGMRVRNFMVSPDAGLDPVPLKRYDVFLSHDTRDRSDAITVRDALAARGVSCFIASQSLPVGSPWKDELRYGVRNARVGVVLLTERAIASHWVLCEIGALWAVGIPIVPVLKGMETTQMPEIISSFQWYSTSDWSDLGPLCDRVHELCRNPPQRRS